jgi:hypothetical protein
MRGLLPRNWLNGAVGAGAAALLAAMAVPAQAMTAPNAPYAAHRMPSATAAQVHPPAATTVRDQRRLAPLRLARRQAESTGRAVPVAADTTQTSVTVAKPDGKFVMTTSVLPERVRQGGTWVPVSAALRRIAGGYRPAATPSGLVLSAGGEGPLAVMTGESGGRLAFSVPFSLPAPSISRDTATYRNVLRGVNLEITASDQGGFNEVLVIRDAAAAANPALRRLRLVTTTRGLTVRTDGHGNLTATAPDGKVEFSGPAPRMWDSAVRGTARRAAAARGPVSITTEPGPGAHQAAVGMRAVAGALVLVPDQRMLSSRSTRFPIIIDPSVNPTSSSTSGYVETQQGCPTYKNYNDSGVTTEGAGYMDYYNDACQGLYRSFYQFNTSNLNSSMHISSATLLTGETFGADETCSHTWPVTLDWTGAISSATDWNTQPAALSQIQTEWPLTAWCGRQDVNFDVLSSMQTTAQNNYTTWTFGLYGDEEPRGYAACAPSSEYNCGFMRFADNPTITTVFDIAPSVPTGTTTTPAAQDNGTTTPGCNGGPVGWIGAGGLGADSGSAPTLNAKLTSNIVGENVSAQYTLWDNSATSGAADTDVVATPASASVASGTTVDTPVGVPLSNGHQYAWTVNAYDGILPSPDSPVCAFDVDLTAPTVPAVTSKAFQPAGSAGSSPPTVGSTGTFSFASTDPVPSGCASACLASGVAYYEYSFNTSLAASGNATATPGQAVSFTPGRWGTNILYVAAVDNAGNVSQTTQYDFYVAWNPAATVAPGDVDGDGVPDLLATDTEGNLLLYPGGSDPAVSPATAGSEASSPDGSGWNTFQITHRGSMSGGSVDDLFAHKGANLYLYLNNQDDPGAAPQFGDTSDIDLISKPSCAATASNASNCTGYDATDWSDASQILAPGSLYSNGLPDLLTVENDQLWLYKGEFGDSVGAPVLLGSSGWSGMTLIAPGRVGGQLTLWTRDNSTGAIYSYPLTLDSNGVPELGTAAVGAPVTATSGTVLSGVTLTAAAYPVVASSGALTGGTCAAPDPTACPGVYAEDASGNLWYYQGESTSGGASPLQGSSSAVLVGSVAEPDAQWVLADGSGKTAADSTGHGLSGTLTGTGWATDSARGTVASFNGTSSSLQFPNGLVESTTEQSWSLWFKTTTPGGVLLSTGHSQIGSLTPSPAAMPVLYVGTDGYLYGEFSTGQVDPMRSTAPVDDGQWHNVVLTGSTSSQVLYLDGDRIGAVGGTILNLDPLNFVGAGYVSPKGWLNAPAVGWSYFTGEVSDVEYFTYPVSPAEVTALNQGQNPLTQLS